MPSGGAGRALQRRGYALLIVAGLIHYSQEADFNLEKWKQQSCGKEEFQCDSRQCIDEDVVCDGSVDCQDGSDETLKICRDIKCPPRAFSCAYGACTSPDARCNNKQDCADGSDEKDCSGSLASNITCNDHQFLCYSGKCIAALLLCDGTKNCDDGSDETEMQCSSLKLCPSYAFRCDYGACIDRAGMCNGVAQCADSSDEKEELCGTGTTTSTPFTSKPTKIEQPSVGCKLPPQPTNGQYRLGGCSPPECQPVSGNSVPDTSYIVYTCHSGFVLSGSQIVLCEGEWSTAFPTCSSGMAVSCPALANPSTEIECTLNGSNVTHYANMTPGTRCRVKCSTLYTTVSELVNYVTDCQANGKWSRDVLPCTQRCGEAPTRYKYNDRGTVERLPWFPWYVGIYQMFDGNYTQVCVGNIVSERIIVTAAHCFWDVATGKQFNIKDFQVAAGNPIREWKEKDGGKFLQLPEIQEIILHNRFRGDRTRSQNDIALIKLKDSLQKTSVVSPICLDFEQRVSLPGKNGTILGWNITESKSQFLTPRETTLPYVSFEKCFDEMPDTFLSYFTHDKFCAGHSNGTSLCPGNSGSGYAVQFGDGKWYLMGLVSQGVPTSKVDVCNIYRYISLTNVSDFYDFIINS